jgi:hypothetical protein
VLSVDFSWISDRQRSSENNWIQRGAGCPQDCRNVLEAMAAVEINTGHRSLTGAGKMIGPKNDCIFVLLKNV